MKLEICANSFQSALNAQIAGADRIELCSELALGGITPSHGLIEKVVSELDIEVYVLIRPRSGNFTFTDEEFDVLKRDIEFCKQIGCHGIVSGVLRNDYTIDIERTKQLIELSSPLDFTFHRAFDLIPNAVEGLQYLMDIGVPRILSSGQQPTAEQGLTLLKKLLQLSESKISIMPGAGIHAANVRVFKEAGFTEIHCSASSVIKNDYTPKLSMSSSQAFDESNYTVSDIEKIRNIRAAIL